MKTNNKNKVNKIIILALILIISLNIVHSQIQDEDGDGIDDSIDPYLNDYDNDGMTDEWEKAHGLRMDKKDSHKDNDHDGLTNLEESKYNTNPISLDSDNDGISDKEEIENNTNPLDPESSVSLTILLIAGILVIIALIGFYLHSHLVIRKQLAQRTAYLQQRQPIVRPAQRIITRPINNQKLRK